MRKLFRMTRNCLNQLVVFIRFQFTMNYSSLLFCLVATLVVVTFGEEVLTNQICVYLPTPVISPMQNEAFNASNKAVFHLTYFNHEHQLNTATAFVVDNTHAAGKVYVFTTLHVFTKHLKFEDPFDVFKIPNLLNFTLWDWQDKFVINGTKCVILHGGSNTEDVVEDFIVFECPMIVEKTFRLSLPTYAFRPPLITEYLFAIGYLSPQSQFVATELTELPRFLPLVSDVKLFRSSQIASTLAGHLVVKVARNNEGGLVIRMYGMVTGALTENDRKTCNEMNAVDSRVFEGCHKAGYIMNIGVQGRLLMKGARR